MKKLKRNYTTLKYNLIILFAFIILSKPLTSNEIIFDIQGNDFTDTDAILSILNEIPDTLNKESTNDIIRVLNDSNLFSDVKVKLIENRYSIIVKEYPNIDQLSFKNNKRLKDEELKLIASEINFTKFNQSSINLYLSELKKHMNLLVLTTYRLIISKQFILKLILLIYFLILMRIKLQKLTK